MQEIVATINSYVWSSALIYLCLGAGLFFSGMTDTRKVLGWLDFFGAWDISLAFVMGGAILPPAVQRLAEAVDVESHRARGGHQAQRTQGACYKSFHHSVSFVGLS